MVFSLRRPQEDKMFVPNSTRRNGILPQVIQPGDFYPQRDKRYVLKTGLYGRKIPTEIARGLVGKRKKRDQTVRMRIPHRSSEMWQRDFIEQDLDSGTQEI